MNYRQPEAMRFEQLLWITNTDARIAAHAIDFVSNKYIPPLAGRDLTHVLALELLRLSM